MGKHLLDIKSEALKCTRCGSCQTVCPVHQEILDEASCARGKAFLIRSLLDSNLAMSKEFGKLMELCLMCGACSENCPSGVSVHKLVGAARADVVQEIGLHPMKKMILRHVLKNRWIFKLGMRSGAIFQHLLFRSAPNGTGMLPRLPMGLDEKRLLAPMANTPFRDRFPARIVVEKPRATVAFFTGCTINYMYPEIGEAVIEVLKKNNINVIIPDTQHCCGLAAYGNGDTATAVELARATMDVFAVEGIDTILTACGSCGSALRKEYPELLKNEAGYSGKVEAFAGKVVDFAEYLTAIGIQGELKPINRTVTYHDSCHLARGQGVTQQPRQLMQSIPGLLFKEMTEPGRCCGMAGSFSLTKYEISRKINQHKIDDIASTGANTLATGCVGCIMHIRDGINQNGLNIEVVHTAQLLAESYRSG